MGEAACLPGRPPTDLDESGVAILGTEDLCIGVPDRPCPWAHSGSELPDGPVRISQPLGFGSGHQSGFESGRLRDRRVGPDPGSLLGEGWAVAEEGRGGRAVCHGEGAPNLLSPWCREQQAGCPIWTKWVGRDLLMDGRWQCLPWPWTTRWLVPGTERCCCWSYWWMGRQCHRHRLAALNCQGDARHRYTPWGEAERCACVQRSGRLGRVVVVGGCGRRRQQHLPEGTCPPTSSAESDSGWDPVGYASPGPAGGQQDLQNFLLRAAPSSWVGSAPAPGCSPGVGRYPLFYLPRQ